MSVAGRVTQPGAVLTMPAATETQRPSVLRRLLRRPPALIAMVVVAAFVIIAVGAPYVAPYDPVKQDFRAIRKAPSEAYRLGTDEVGRDVLSRLIWGARASLLAGVIPVSIALVVSIPLGLLVGVHRRLARRAHHADHRRHAGDPLPDRGDRPGRLPGPEPDQRHDRDRHRRPAHVLATGPGHRAGDHDRGLHRVRARRWAARACASPCATCCPTSWPPLLIQSSLTAAAAIIAEASLSFLGLGQQPPAPSWGSMLNAAQRYLVQAPWMAIYPGLMIFGIVMSLNVLGDALRDALDPKHG